jgi:hypothetical protein
MGKIDWIFSGFSWITLVFISKSFDFGFLNNLRSSMIRCESRFLLYGVGASFFWEWGDGVMGFKLRWYRLPMPTIKLIQTIAWTS